MDERTLKEKIEELISYHRNTTVHSKEYCEGAINVLKYLLGELDK